MRLIISGAGGFLGRHLIKKAVEEGIGVAAITSQVDKISTSYANTVDIYGRYDYKKILVSKDDIFVNCAFPRNYDGVEMGKGLNYIQDLLTYFVDNGIGSVINISSQSVYDSKRKRPAIETDEVCLDTPYAVGKYTTELLTNSICKRIRHTNIRLGSLIGVGFDERFINKMIIKAIDGEKITAQVGNQIFSFLDVRDASDGIIAFIANISNNIEEKYNFSSLSIYNMKEIVKIIKEKTGCDTEMEMRNIDYNNSIDSTLFFELSKYRIAYNLSDSIRDIYTEILKKQ